MNAARSMTVLVVDDEPLAAGRLAELTEAIPGCRVLAQAGNAEQALDLLQQHAPDVVLLDISMPGLSGLELANALQGLKHPPFIIFCTAHDQHALKAFEAHAVDYLLKPVRRERLQESLERVFRLKNLPADAARRLFVTASVGGAMRRIALEDIYFLHADEKYTMVYHRGGEHILDESLKDLEQRFPEQFLRIHRNCLVKDAQLLEIRRDADGHAWAVLQDWPKPLEISRRCAGELKDRFKHA